MTLFQVLCKSKCGKYASEVPIVTVAFTDDIFILFIMNRIHKVTYKNMKTIQKNRRHAYLST